ncbi:MAG: PTS mannose/fructose/sorbose transporter family subunit IID [Deltaproteobacteria bacterium]|nr:MAG: PTS mannose/fructose/sorbose transporter family subunit IID [Deltaproteobacteria bacterium]
MGIVTVMERLRGKILWTCVLRGLLLQASWGFEKMQGIGAMFVIAPALRRLVPQENRSEHLRRYLDYFNTHPFLALPVLGGMLHQEAEGPGTVAAGEEFGRMLMAPYAAMGDALFWGGLRPLAAVIALFLAVAGQSWAGVALLAVFNVPALYFRVAGFFRGWAEGGNLVETVQRWRLPDLAIRAKEGTIVLLGGWCAYWLTSGLEQEELAPGWGLLALPGVVAGAFLVRVGVSPLMLVFAVLALWVPLVLLFN